MSEEDRILALFRDEASERLDAIVAILMRAEAGSSGADDVAALFREAHSLKGSAGMLGLDDVHELAHALEDVLAEARRVGRLRREMVDPLLRVSDALRAAVGGDPAARAAGLQQLRLIRDAEPLDGDGTGELPAALPSVGEVGAAETRPLRVDPAKIDRVLDVVGETVLHQRRLERALRHSHAAVDADLLDGGQVLLDELQDATIELRTVPFESITGAFPRGVRDLAAAQGKEAALHVSGAETQLDRVVLAGTADALSHLLRNAVAHGIETPQERIRAGKPAAGRIELRVAQRGDRVEIEVRDDGRGVAPELLETAARQGSSLAELLAEAGLSTSAGVSAAAGRGVGLDAVRRHVQSLGGTLEVHSETGRYAAVRMLLPLSVAVVGVLLAERAGQVLGVPIACVSEVTAQAGAVSLSGRRALPIEGQAVPLVDLLGLLGGAGRDLPERPTAIVLSDAYRRVAALCDRVLGEADVVIKPFGPLLAGIPGYLGAALLDDGRIALIADPAHLLSGAEHVPVPLPARPSRQAAPTVLVVDDQFTIRELQRSILEAAGYSVHTARHGREAWELLTAAPPADVVVTDIEMPEMDGFELLEAIRRHPELASTPVVIITSRSRQEDELRGLQAGADAYIVKERFDQQAMLDTVGRLVGR